MRLRKLAACAAAIMCAAAITAVPVSAAVATVASDGYVLSDTGMFLVMLYSDGKYDASTKKVTNYGIDLTKIATVDVTINVDIKIDRPSMGSPSNVGSFKNDAGGAIVMSSKSPDDASSHNWNVFEWWGVNDEDIGYQAASYKRTATFNKVEDGVYKATVTLSEDDKTAVIAGYNFVQFGVSQYGGTDNITVQSIEMKDASGNVLISFDSNGKANLEQKPIEDKAAAEETKTEETKEETKTEETKTEETKTEEAAPAKEETKEEVKETAPKSGTYTAEFGAQFDSSLGDEWPSFSDKTVKFDYDKEASISIDMGSEVAFGGNYIAVNTDAPFIEGVSTGKITSFKLDGKEIPLGETYVNGEGTNGGVRLTILNLWNDQIENQPLDVADLPATFQTIDIKFVVDTPEEVAIDGEEVDWTLYDEAAAIENNENFELGGKIDLYAALGDDWDKFTKVEADFTWDAGTGWCGGAGIGGGATLADGTAWISGAEFGAANANEGVVNDGKVTQTIIDMNGETLATIATANDDGTTSFGEMQVQKWWNCDEANAKVTAIRFIDAAGTVVKELKYGDNAVVVDSGNVAAATDTSKENPATGVADVAAVAGLAVVAAGTAIVAKKRK